MIKVKIGFAPEWAGTVITILAKRQDGFHQVLPFNLTFAPIKAGEETSPCLVLDERSDGEELLHALAQGLAEAGYIPDVSRDKENELVAVKYHLEDMRKLVFKGK